jgi:hypothetical protein
MHLGKTYGKDSGFGATATAKAIDAADSASLIERAAELKARADIAALQ